MRALGRTAWWGCVLLILAALLPLLPHLGSGTELVRLRNALLLGPDLTPGFDWEPPSVPEGFLVDPAPDPEFVALARRLGLAALPDDWQRALAIARHLLANDPQVGGALKSNLHDTYRGIVVEGRGYCADFVRVFNATAQAAGIPVRSWAFSFDGFGGHGHVFPEIWNRQQRRWQLLDVFDNYYFVQGGEEPLSALQFKRALAQAAPGLALRAIEPKARAGYPVEAKAWDYFRRGVAQWYLWWGSNVHSYDEATLVRVLSPLSRGLEQLGAMVHGVHPLIRILPEPGNEKQRAAMRSMRVTLAASAASATLGGIGLLLMFARRRAQARVRRALPEGDGAFLPVKSSAGPVWPRVCVVGPLPPPSGGMANQCEQLVRLLRAEGATVDLVRTNEPYRPKAVARVPMLRALLRLLPYLVSLWRTLGRVDVVHVFANSGWAWHLLAMPAVAIARWRGVAVIVNYRGGNADTFFSSAPRHVLRSLRASTMRITPSSYLLRVFRKHGLDAEVIPNIIDLSRFTSSTRAPTGSAPHLIVTRNLEAIYDIPTALHAFAAVRRRFPAARLTVAGSGPEHDRLSDLAAQLGLGDSARFVGRIDNAEIASLYAEADLMLNPSTVDNMPISILEAMASGVPVVSTDAGGIPDMVVNGVSALLVPVGDADAMAAAAIQVLADAERAATLRRAGLDEVGRYAWPRVMPLWQDAYRRAALMRSRL
jgi:glycosyltransferase involved in cell wall biosynthesis